MPVINLTFSDTAIGYIVRGKRGENDDPGLNNQHSDCILSDGAPVGFFGDENFSGGGKSLSAKAAVIAGAFSGIAKGQVYYYQDFLNHSRGRFVNRASAKAYNSVSTVMVISVTQAQSQAFDQYWASMKQTPIRFRAIGKNCSTVASRSFQAAGILSSSIPVLDTPERLWRQLRRDATVTRIASGYLGFTRNGARFDVSIDTGF